jgi:ribonuclease HI
LYEEIKANIKVEYVKAHCGIEGNELADRMAIVAISAKNKEYKEYQYSSINSILRDIS